MLENYTEFQKNRSLYVHDKTEYMECWYTTEIYPDTRLGKIKKIDKLCGIEPNEWVDNETKKEQARKV